MVRVTKWSVRKFLGMMSMLGDLFDQALKKLSKTGADFDLPVFIGRIAIEVCQSEARFVKLIMDSVADPKFSRDDILELDPEDAFSLVEAALEVNLTEKLQKKILGMFEKVMGPLKEEEANEEVSSKSADSQIESENLTPVSGDLSPFSSPEGSASAI